MLSNDCIYAVIQYLPVRSIYTVTVLSKQWKYVVLNMQPSDWRHLFLSRVGLNLPVSSTFDWRYALRVSEQPNNEITATCTWSKQQVKLVSPCQLSSRITCSDGSIIINSDLRDGIRRVMQTTLISRGFHVHYVYDMAFELKGVRMTCVRRGKIPCKNCVKRRHCLDQEYVYYLRKLEHPYVNDYLCMRVRRVMS